MLTGTIDKMGNDFFVKYVTTFHDEPIQQTVWWKVARVEQTRWNDGRWEKLLARGWVAA